MEARSLVTASKLAMKMCCVRCSVEAEKAFRKRFFALREGWSMRLLLGGISVVGRVIVGCVGDC